MVVRSTVVTRTVVFPARVARGVAYAALSRDIGKLRVK
jgi:hypothetical protein